MFVHMKTISATFLRTNCYKVLREVETKLVSYLITKRGKLVARLVPISPKEVAMPSKQKRGDKGR